MNRATLAYIATAAFAILAPRTTVAQVATSATLRPAILQAVRDYIDAQNKADAASVVEMYSREPGTTSVGDGEITRGWDAIRSAFDQLIGAQGRYRIDIGSTDVTPLGPGHALALTTYTLTLNTAAGETQMRGAMTLVFHSEQGQWKIVHDHTSTKAAEGATPGGAGQASVAPPVAPPVQPVAPAAAIGPIMIANGSAYEIKTSGHLDYKFELPAGVCAVTGRITGVSGGNRDFEAFIFDEDNYRNWAAGGQTRLYWQSGRVVVSTISGVNLAGPATFHLVVSNVWSLLTPKTVQVQAMAQC